jgi:hypothetical protein
MGAWSGRCRWRPAVAPGCGSAAARPTPTCRRSPCPRASSADPAAPAPGHSVRFQEGRPGLLRVPASGRPPRSAPAGALTRPLAGVSLSPRQGRARFRPPRAISFRAAGAPCGRLCAGRPFLRARGSSRQAYPRAFSRARAGLVDPGAGLCPCRRARFPPPCAITGGAAVRADSHPGSRSRRARGGPVRTPTGVPPWPRHRARGAASPCHPRALRMACGP